MLKEQPQPTIYKNEDELVEWLEWDLYQQRLEIATSKNIPFDKNYLNYRMHENKTNDDINEDLKTKIDDKELTLNIGKIRKIEDFGFDDSYKREINFEFNFKSILKKLGITNEEENIICPYSVNCTNVTFSGEANFDFTTFSGEADFIGSTFSGQAYFERSIFSGRACFIQSTFSLNTRFNYSAFRGKAYFERSIFSGEPVFNYSTFSVEASFVNSIFRIGAYFKHSIFSGEADFIGSTFSGMASFDFSTFSGKADFIDSTFSGEADFIGSTFSGEANFDFTTFSKEAYFIQSTFSGGASFYESIFSGEAYFNYSTFTGKTYFSNIKFKENKDKDKDTISIIFDNIQLENNSYISFNAINYDDETKKLIENENSKIEIINTVINGRVEFNNVYLSELNLEGSNIVGTLNRINLKAYPSNSDTACILKNEELKRNNTIKALEFKAIEKDLYKKELDKNKSIKNFGVRFSLWLSKLSNNHGQDWIRAFWFTVLFGLLFFILSYIPYCINILLLPEPKYDILIKLAKNFIPSYLEYFIPTKYNYIPTVLDKVDDIPFYIKSISSVFYFFGKIATGYGIVEIVQAFRKLNSKG